jgi:hypothetical protein
MHGDFKINFDNISVDETQGAALRGHSVDTQRSFWN